MINVDLETRNVSGGAGTDCQSPQHKLYGRHYDFTVHSLECGCRGNRAADRPPQRYWDNKNGEGYTLQEVVGRLQDLQSQHADAYPRRCHVCGVQANVPHWD